MDGFSITEEVRNGYNITEKQKKIWAIELDLFQELLRVCKKHDIKVFAYAGTILGAVRHKGFIPWDDDMDACLERKEYEKLLAVAPYEFKDPYFFQTDETDKKYFTGFSRLRNSNTTGIITGMEDIDYNNGIYIDVFVLDDMPENKFKRTLQLDARAIVFKLVNLYYNDDLQGIKKVIKSILVNMVKRGSLVKLYNKLLQISKDSNKVTLMTHSKAYCKRYWCYKEDLKEQIMLPFENIMIPVPQNYERMLENFYGDYMKFPPVEERGEWHEGIITFDPDTPYKEFIRKKQKDESKDDIK